MKAFLLSLLIFAVGAVRALAARYKTELVTAAVVGLAVLFASPFDRWLVIASAVMAFLIGHKYGAPRGSIERRLKVTNVTSADAGDRRSAREATNA